MRIESPAFIDIKKNIATKNNARNQFKTTENIKLPIVYFINLSQIITPCITGVHWGRTKSTC